MRPNAQNGPRKAEETPKTPQHLSNSSNHPKNISESTKNQLKIDQKSTYDDSGWPGFQKLQTCQEPRLALIWWGPGRFPERRQPLGAVGGQGAKVEKISVGKPSRARKSKKSPRAFRPGRENEKNMKGKFSKAKILLLSRKIFATENFTFVFFFTFALGLLWPPLFFSLSRLRWIARGKKKKGKFLMAKILLRPRKIFAIENFTPHSF